MRIPVKVILFRLHWIAGLCAGLVLAVVGFTGGLLGFEQPILAAINPQFHLAALERPALTPDQWIARVRAAYPGYVPRSIDWSGDNRAITLHMARNGQTRGGIEAAVDPYTGAILGKPRGAGFFRTVEKVHRTLAAGPIGKQIVGASTAMLIMLIVSGLYLRWPRRPGSLSTWLRPNLALRGRGLWWNLHAVAGTWLLAFYMVAALTGLWWSYGFYREAVNHMAGITTPLRRPAATPPDTTAPLLPVAHAWVVFRGRVPEGTNATIALSSDVAAPVTIRYQTAASPHERAWNTLRIGAATGDVVGLELYTDLPRGRRFVSSLFPLHSGSFLGEPGRLAMALASFLMPLFAITGLWLWLLRRRTHAAQRGSAGQWAVAIGTRAPANSLRDPAVDLS